VLARSFPLSKKQFNSKTRELGFCLQDAVLRCCDGFLLRRMRLRFDISCRDFCGSGVCGSVPQARNFAATGIGLYEEGLFVWVVCRCEAESFPWRRWALGNAGGQQIGVLVWMTHQQHVSRLVGGGVDLFVSQVPDGTFEMAPWWNSLVGAPKRRGVFRGVPAQVVYRQRAAAAALALEASGEAPPVDHVVRGELGIDLAEAPVEAPPNDNAVRGELGIDLAARPCASASGDSGSEKSGGRARDGGVSVHVRERNLSESDDSVNVVRPCRQRRLSESSSSDALGTDVVKGTVPYVRHCADGSDSSGAEPVLPVLRRSRRLEARATFVPGDRITEVTDAMWKEYSWGPHGERCMARLYKRGKFNGHQCNNHRLPGADFCASHTTTPSSAGRVDKSGSVELYKIIRKYEEERALVVSRKEKRGTHMYTRHHMWHFAVKVRAADLASGPLEHLCELTDSEARIAFEKMTKHLKCNVPRGGGNVLEVGNGPSKARDLDDLGLASYNGRDGGKFWKYYDLGEFKRQLNALGTDMGCCTERQCVDALRKTSLAIAKWSTAARGTIKPYVGPQCFPHITDVKRTGLVD